MKKTLISLVFLFGVLSAASAQEKPFNRLYGAFNITSGGAPNLNFSSKDFANRSFGVEIGYRFTPSFSLFTLATADINLLNCTTTKNYNETGTLGLGAAYAFNIGNNTYIEPVISCASTYLKTDLNYLTPKFEIRWGTKNPWNKNSQLGPYVGLGLQYIHPYNNPNTPNMLMSYATLGFKLF
jgi:hypothetical protein